MVFLASISLMCAPVHRWEWKYQAFIIEHFLNDVKLKKCFVFYFFPLCFERRRHQLIQKYVNGDGNGDGNFVLFNEMYTEIVKRWFFQTSHKTFYISYERPSNRELIHSKNVTWQWQKWISYFFVQCLITNITVHKKFTCQIY